MVHIRPLGSTTVVDTTKLRDEELGQLLETLATKSKTRIQIKHKELNEIENEQVKFLSKCRNLAQSIIPGPMEAGTDKPLEKSYQLFESVVVTLRVHIQNTKEETSRLLMQHYTTFLEAYKVLQEHMEEYVIT